MNGYDISEKDWKVFRKKLPGWQEAFMGKLCIEYIELLQKNEPASSRFWELEEKIKNDKRMAGVQVRLARSQTLNELMSLLEEGAISIEDLSEFSEDLQDRLKYYKKMLDERALMNDED